MRDNKVILGEGWLNWERTERASDRYGSVCLDLGPKVIDLFIETMTVPVHNNDLIVGTMGKLVAVVLDNDPTFNRQIRAKERLGLKFKLPKVGGRYVLGHGRLFFTEKLSVGLASEDDRENEWLNPKSLGKLQGMKVRLIFVKD